MKRLRQSLLVVALVLAGILVWYRVTSPPAPRVAEQPQQTAPPAATTAPDPDSYALADGAIIRWIPSPDPEKRRQVLEQLGRAVSPDGGPVVSLTIGWDDGPYFRSYELGFSYAPRPLLRVLADSLEVPMHQLRGLDIARKIGVPGDWIIRRDADLDACMTHIEQVVRQSGYPGFRVVRLTESLPACEMCGVAHAPEQPLAILPPHPDVPPVHVQSGTLRQFAEALGAAIQRPLTMHAEPLDLRLPWRDHASAYRDLGPAITDKMVADTLEDVSAGIGVTFEESEVELTVWQLELTPAMR
jgi:hypothetical protein